MRLSVLKTILRLLTISSWPLFALAQTPVDSVSMHDIQTVVVSGKTATASVSMFHDGTIRWDRRMFRDLPQVLGNADPVHYAQMLPGIQTSSEMDAGLHIQGSDQSHNIFSIQGVPVYNAAHLLGLFSVFNASHYSAMTLKKNVQEAEDPARLGGRLNMELDSERTDTIGGEVAVGAISSQGTLRMPTGRRSSLVLSGRGSYLNLFYGHWLREDDMKLYYSFYDVNATWLFRPRHNHRLWIDCYMGDDNIRMNENEYQARMNIQWGNRIGAIHWEMETPAASVRNSCYITSYRNRMRLSQADAVFHLPSDIFDVGYRGQLGWQGLTVGAEATWHNILPQDPQAEGLYNTLLSGQERFHTQEYVLHAGYDYAPIQMLSLNAGVRGTAYIDYAHRAHYAADPSLSVRLRGTQWNVTASYSVRHQYIFQTGTSSLGMPTEFWTSIGPGSPPQWGHGAVLTANLYLADGRYRLSADVYYRRLRHQVEYDGDIMKFLNTDYRLEDNLLHGRGHNYGFSVMAHKRSGRLTGWISYAYGRARRTFHEEGLHGTFPANHERPHEANALLTWHLHRRCTLSGIYTFASGTPFTAPEHFYIMNGMLLAEYGAHNAHRLRPYSRLDLSVSLLFRRLRIGEHGLNLSVYNVTGHDNDITCRLKIHQDHYLYSHFALLKFPLPSVSYFIRF